MHTYTQAKPACTWGLGFRVCTCMYPLSTSPTLMRNLHALRVKVLGFALELMGCFDRNLVFQCFGLVLNARWH